MELVLPRTLAPLSVLLSLWLGGCPGEGRVRARTKSAPPAVPIGMNLAQVTSYATALPWRDLMRGRGEPQSTNAPHSGPEVWNTGAAGRIPRDGAGYPLQLPVAVEGQPAPQVLRIPVAMASYPGRYDLVYDGDGDFEFPASPVRVVAKTPGRVVLDVRQDPRTIMVTITRSARGDHVRNLRLLGPGAQTAHEAQPFHPDFLRGLAGVGALRFMDWGRTNGSPLQRWQQRPLPDQPQGTARGVAVEWMIDLANELGADAWLCVPHRADDQYVREVAKLVQGRLGKSRRVYVEYSNELWNGIFEQTKWAREQGCAAGLSALGMFGGDCRDDGARHWAAIKWNARRSAEIFRIFEQVLGGSERLVRVLGSQSANATVARVLLDAFHDPKINPLGGAADALAVAPYFGAHLGDDLVKRGKLQGLGVDELMRLVERTVEPSIGAATRENKAIADQYGLRLVAYEAGQHLVGTGPNANDERLTELLVRANRHPRMGVLYKRMFDTWHEASGGELLVLFNYIEKPGKFGSWGLLEAQDQPPELSPKYQAYRKRLPSP